MFSRNLAVEAIDFQNDMFFKELCLAYTKIREESKGRGEGNPDHAALLSSIVKAHTKLKTSFNLGSEWPSVHTPLINRNHVLYKNRATADYSMTEATKLIRDHGQQFKGSINLRTNTVTGVFTDVDSTINMPTDMINGNKYSVEELAAITLHEVGHLMTYYEFISRTMSTNQILAGVAKGMDGSGSVEEREALFMTVKEAAKLKNFNPSQLAKTSDKRVAETVILKAITEQCESELGSDIYDLNSWEMLADQYATRCGAGRALVTGLDKILRDSNISYRSMSKYLFWEAVKFTMLAASLYALTTPAAASGIMIIMLVLLSDYQPAEYDRPEARLKRIRNQLVERLKDKSVSKAERLALEEDLVVIDSITANVTDRLPLFTAIGNYMVKNSRYDQEKLQNDLESLVNNDLFIASAALRNLG